MTEIRCRYNLALAQKMLKDQQQNQQNQDQNQDQNKSSDRPGGREGSGLILRDKSTKKSDAFLESD